MCGEALGDDVTLDIMSISDGVYRLTCPQLVYDGGHDVGVELYYRIDKDNTREVLTGIAMKRWCDRGKLAAVMFEWLMARRLIGENPKQNPSKASASTSCSPRRRPRRRSQQRRTRGAPDGNRPELHDRLDTYISQTSYDCEPDDQYDTLAPNTDDMRAQLEFVFGGVPDDHREGLIEIAHTNARGDVNQAQLFRTDQIEEAVEFAAAKNRERLNVYFGAALRKPDTPPFGRAKATDVLCATCGWVDCDDQGAAKQAKENWGRLPPSLFGITGTKDDGGGKEHYRAHFYYRYDTPLVDHEQIRSVQKMLVAKFGGDKSVHNPDRVMRLMGSIAWPTPKKPNRVPEMTRIKALNKPGRPNYAVEELVREFAPAPAADLLATTAPTTPPQEPTTAVAPPAQEPTSPASPSSSGGLGLIPPLLTEGREGAMLSHFGCCLEGINRRAPRLPNSRRGVRYRVAAALRKYAEHVPGKVSRGKAEMMQKCVSAILKFKNGGFAGMETLEKIIASYERKRREEGKLPATAMSSEPHVVTDPGPFPATDFKGTPPARTWVVPDWIPAGTVTSLYGDGGTGKSLLALQLMYSAATGAEWLGLPVPKMRSLGVFCEDDREELWRRHENIAAAAGHTIGNPYGAAILWPRTGHDNLLVTYDGNGKPEPTPLFDLVQKEIIDRRIELLVIDTAADTFGGNEIIRAQANNFIKAVCGGFILSAAAHGIVLTVLLLAHPSQAGRNSGSGESGSTGWNNAVRSRLYLARPKDGLPDERVLTRKKANYARAGDDQSINLLWHEGVLVTPFGEPRRRKARHQERRGTRTSASDRRMGERQSLQGKKQRRGPQARPVHDRGAGPLGHRLACGHRRAE